MSENGRSAELVHVGVIETPSDDSDSNAASIRNRVRLESFLEWKARCAMGLCSVAVQGELCEFGGLHFARYVRRYAHRTNTPCEGSILAGRDAWHLYETYLTVRSNREGKRYKDWLFDRCVGMGESEVEAVVGGAVLLMRDVVRDHLRRECAPARMLSLQSPLGSPEESGLTLEDMLPGNIDPVDEVAGRELERLASMHAEELMARMELRDKVAVLAKNLGLSLAHPAVEKAAGCRKSVLNECYKNFITQTARWLKASYKEDDPDTVRILTLLTLKELGTCLRTWGRTSAQCSSLLAAVEAS